ncbi:uncharacterized protein MELLADRAFT_86506 [Melampsora larici-populina 98AG31]|uniref:Uncharacterized protein n=1 Tax=Melampsora larici-populina (strain 98AG31 / pathotype 3-4-7) TaxID=747676 RepID=F4RM32_MELLP|nr:uncharacterized protein MELLADRAFT_86506 [Melampsora larici-populina 98AG31]EGG06651.1 hypothetical protein MELLADRAFT_86506 [Melampsora larici-populina 98AG31]
MHSLENDGNRPSDLSSYQRCALPLVSSQISKLAGGHCVPTKLKAEVAPTKHNWRLSVRGKSRQQSSLDNSSRRNQAHYIPSSSFAISIKTYGNHSSASDQETPSNTSIPVSHPTLPSKKFGSQAKQAFGRFCSSAKRTFTIDALVIKPINHKDQPTKVPRLKRMSTTNTKRPKISYPMKLHNPEFAFIASKDPWVYGSSDSDAIVPPLRRHATCGAVGRPVRPARTSRDVALRRSLRYRRQILSTAESSDRGDLPARPSAPEPMDMASSSEECNKSYDSSKHGVPSSSLKSSITSKSVAKNSFKVHSDTLEPLLNHSSFSTDSDYNRPLRRSPDQSRLDTERPSSSLSSFTSMKSDPDPYAGILRTKTNPIIPRASIRFSEEVRFSPSLMNSSTPNLSTAITTQTVKHCKPSMILNSVLKVDSSSDWYDDLMNSIDRKIGNQK